MPSVRFLSARGLLLALIAASALSCSQAAKLNQVSGKLLHKGQPLSGALVAFHPEGGVDINRQATTGLTKEDGSFSLTTGDVQGAPAGTYKVTVIHMVPIKTGAPTEGSLSMSQPETEDSLKGAFANADTSQIKVTIKDGANQLEPIDLK